MRTVAPIFVLFLSLASLAPLQADANEVKIDPDIVYGHKDGLAMTFDVYHPEGEPNGAAVVFMVSGGWVSKWSPPKNTLGLFKPFLDKGFHVFAVRHGSSPRYGIPDAFADVTRAVRFIRKHGEKRFGVDPERLGVLGMSAGGHLSLMLGTASDDGKKGSDQPLEQESARVAAVVALVPPTDLRVAVWEAPESLPAYRNFPALNLDLKKAGEHSPLVHVTPDDAPSLVIMGGKDELVPAKHGTWIAEAFEREKVQHKLIILPDAGHDLGATNHARVFSESIEWFVTHLSKKAEK